MTSTRRIGPGPVVVTTATGERVKMWAMTDVVRGRDFPVVWVCAYDGADTDGVPWPLEAVEIDNEDTP